MTIYYLAPDLQRPSGGVRTIYRHVDALNDTGRSAAVVHARSGFRCSWFENETRVVDLPITLDASDLVVVPEESVGDLARIAPGARKVVFNQNAYRTFRGLADPARSPYVTCPDLVAAMVVSEDSEHYLRYCFPELTIGRIRHALDPAIFHPVPGRRTRQIAAVPAKRPAELRQLIDVLSARGVLRDWRFVRIEGMSESEVARTLQASPLFVSLNKAEGFGLPPAEAIACITGPGAAKLAFERHIARHHPGLAARVVGVETVDHPTPGELEAFARTQFVRVDALSDAPADVQPRRLA